jgi:hypothetical protein
MKLEKYSLGVGDRFARQAQAQLRACMLAADQGVEVIPVWNKSNREHLLIGSEPADTRRAADRAVRALGWKHSYRVDADHVGLETVDRFIPHSDFYTIDVADWIGKPAPPAALRAFVSRHPELSEPMTIPGVDHVLRNTTTDVERLASKYLLAVQQAGRIYRHIAREKGEDRFITEVSFDETDSPQTPPELLVILAALADEGIPAQTVAPKFTGRFNKGVDYAADVARFEREFSDDLSIIAFAVKQYSLPASLKLSVHSGSDKFSLYAPMRRTLTRLDAGLHLKTAGTTWLEEIIGLAEADGPGLVLAKEIYSGALAQLDELCAPYASVIDIDGRRLPRAETVQQWSAQQFVSAVRHDPRNPVYNSHVRQLLHVGYKVAAQIGKRYLDALEAHEASVSRNVTANLFERHIKPLFLDGAQPAPPVKTEKGMASIAATC